MMSAMCVDGQTNLELAEPILLISQWPRPGRPITVGTDETKCADAMIHEDQSIN